MAVTTQLSLSPERKTIYTNRHLAVSEVVNGETGERYMMRQLREQGLSADNLDKWFANYDDYQLTVTNYKYLPRVHSVNHDHGSQAYALLDFETGDMLINNGSLGKQELEQLLDAIDHLHRKSFIHGSIDAQNIWITEHGRVLLYGAGESQAFGLTSLSKDTDVQQLIQVVAKYCKNMDDQLKHLREQKVTTLRELREILSAVHPREKVKGSLAEKNLPAERPSAPAIVPPPAPPVASVIADPLSKKSNGKWIGGLITATIGIGLFIFWRTMLSGAGDQGTMDPQAAQAAKTSKYESSGGNAESVPVKASQTEPASAILEPAASDLVKTADLPNPDDEIKRTSRFRIGMKDTDGSSRIVYLQAANETANKETKTTGTGNAGDSIYEGNYKLYIENSGKLQAQHDLAKQRFNLNRNMVFVLPGDSSILAITQYGDSSNDIFTLFQLRKGKLYPLTFAVNNGGAFFGESVKRDGELYITTTFYNSTGEGHVSNKWQLNGNTFELKEEPAPSYSNNQLADFIKSYITTSISAVNSYDFNIVKPYIDPLGKSYNEQKNYISYLKGKGISEKLVSARATDVKPLGGERYEVATYEEYIIYYGDGTSKAKNFDSRYLVVGKNNGLFVNELLETKERKATP